MRETLTSTLLTANICGKSTPTWILKIDCTTILANARDSDLRAQNLFLTSKQATIGVYNELYSIEWNWRLIGTCIMKVKRKSTKSTVNLLCTAVSLFICTCIPRYSQSSTPSQCNVKRGNELNLPPQYDLRIWLKIRGKRRTVGIQKYSKYPWDPRLQLLNTLF